MSRSIGLLTAFLLLTAINWATAQTQPQPQQQPQPWRGSSEDSRPVAGPNQPVGPQHPQLRRRNEPLQAPFRLTPQHAAYLDRVLNVWEQHSNGVKTFDCDFFRWVYDPVFGPRNQPKHVDWGKIKYASPDRGMFRVKKTQKGRDMVDVEPERAEHWVCDGKSVFEHNYAKKRLTEYKLPPELHGKAIEDGPLPFLFGANATKLKRRYFMRVITPQNVKDQIWLEAHPRFQQDAANFRRAELILKAKDMSPFALQIFAPNGKNHTVYQFENIVRNDPLRILKGNPFQASTPFGWQKTVEAPRAPQVGSRPAEGARQ